MRARLRAYRLACSLESLARRFTGAKGPSNPLALEETVPFGWPVLAQPGTRSLVLFAGTIGEFNAVRPFIDAYRRQWPQDRLVLLAGRAQYAEALHDAMPQDVVALPVWRAPHVVDRFLRLSKPRLVAYAEGPSLHARFPIRLELPLSAACLDETIPLIVLNAKIYEPNLASRIDRYEHGAFADLHREAVHHWFTPDDQSGEELKQAGAPAERISVVGDLKFDNAASGEEELPPGLATVLSSLCKEGGPLVVGGSVNAIDDQKCLVDAWLELRRAFPKSRLVIAPRYLEHSRVVEELRRYLESVGVSCQLRSQLDGGPVEADVLIIDVFGELRFYYGAASICYVGRNHGILEPLRYRKPTVVADDWRRDHPSFALYHKIVESGAVVHVRDKTELGAAFVRIMRDKDFVEEITCNAARLIDANAGAAQRIMAELKKSVLSGEA